MTFNKIFSLLSISIFLIPNTFAGEVTGSVNTGVGAASPTGVITSPPTLSPVAGSYSSTQSVSFSLNGAVYSCYTTNNATPECDWNNLTCTTGTKYSSAISVSSSTTIKAVSCYAGAESSSVGSNTYTISTSTTTSPSSGGGGGGGSSDSGGDQATAYLGCSPVLSNITPLVNQSYKSISEITVEVANNPGKDTIKITANDKELPLTITENSGIFAVSADASSLTQGTNKISIYAEHKTQTTCAPRNYLYSLEISETGANPTTGNYFTDTEKHWGKDYVNFLKSKKIINGKKDGLFYPDETITRAEATKIATLAFNIEQKNSEEKIFNDVETTDWYHPYVTWAKNASIISKKSDGLFNPNKPISRAEALKILLLSAKKKIESGIPSFSDVPQDSWFMEYVITAKKLGIIKGKADGKFYPSQNITRAEFSKIVAILMQQ